MTLKRSWIKRSSKPWPSKSAADHARTRRQRKALKQGRTCVADSTFSRAVRELAEWHCERCRGDFSERRYLLTCSHFISRRIAATRYDFDNCVSLCQTCHTGPGGWEYAKDTEYRDWMIERLGAVGFAALEERAKQVVKYKEARREFLEMVRRGDTEKLREAA